MEINKKIQRIEDKDANYINNKKWQELRQEQDHLYYLIAKQKISVFNGSRNPNVINRISKYQKFIDDYEKN